MTAQPSRSDEADDDKSDGLEHTTNTSECDSSSEGTLPNALDELQLETVLWEADDKRFTGVDDCDHLDWGEGRDIVSDAGAYLGYLSSLINGWSSIPVFMICVILALHLLYSRTAMWLLVLETAPPLGTCLFLFARIFVLALTVCTILWVGWQSLNDSVTERPIMCPMQLRSFKRAVNSFPASKPGDARLLLMVFHAIFAVVMLLYTEGCQQEKLLTSTEAYKAWLFPINFAVKLAMFCLACKGSSTGWRDLFIVYSSSSDLLLFGYIALPDLVGAAEDWFPSEIDHDRRREILAFNMCLMSISNLCSYSVFMLRLARQWDLPMRSAYWSETVMSCRVMSSTLTLVGWVVATLRTGFMPSFFSMILLFTGTSVNRLLLLITVEALRTVTALYCSVRSMLQSARCTLRNLSGTKAGFSGPVVLYGLSGTMMAGAIISNQARDSEQLWPSLLLGLTLWVCLTYRKLAGRMVNRLDIVLGLPILLVLFLSVSRMFKGAGEDTQLFTIVRQESTLNVSSLVGTCEITLGEVMDRGHEAISGGLDASHSEEPMYPFCALSYRGVNLMDFAIMSFLSYMPPESDSFNELFAAFKGDDDWVVVDQVSGVFNHQYTEFFSERRGTTVLSLRGTNPLRIMDVVQDVLLFHRAFAFQVVAQFVPLLRWVPPMWTSYALALGELPLNVFGHFDPKAYYHHALTDYVKLRTAAGPVLLTGHSLGGGVAKIVGAATNVPVIAISSPGVYLSSRMFNVSGDALAFLETNLVADNDLISGIDRLQGTVLRVGCLKTNPLHCHQPGQTVCELANRCRLPLGGRRISSCRHLT